MRVIAAAIPKAQARGVREWVEETADRFRGVLCLLAGITIVLVILNILVLNIQFRRRLGRHRGMSRTSFLRYFVDRGFDAALAAAVFDYYHRKAIWGSFEISPSDEMAVLFN
jgi:hypothetical protein